ncbi:hypothetical protein ACJQWK_10179 [Exserohilum turcicum]|uniref:ER transporter 6TM N-terminal domain-containing protein n=1 Tax=Exserohilum turcicum (strain 28A) TaxID=671987 RepID=R0IR36_EXST2|nr:uncharacterized protein SETTUDRAFT_19884 [Exserohilum turcica Et28A]EOA87360.1 hypothetical protein SETTUDRAFT_19884 [Exserohilum turcica Et28A]
MASSATARNAENRDEADSNATARSTPSQEQQQPTGGYQQNVPQTQEDGETKKEKKPSKLKAAWDGLGLDVPTLLMMGKAALPPTIALAMCQADAVAHEYSTLGYLAAIISIIGFCIMPRAKFVQTMIMNVLGACIGAAAGLLMVWSGVKARDHTTDPSAPPQRYNSSQSVVLAMWLFFQIYAINTVKAKFPQLTFPTMLYAIFVNVAATSGILFRTVPQCEAFIKRLLIIFLTGLGIATGVSLLIIPVTSRKVVMKEFAGYIGLLKGALGAHKTYLHSLEDGDMYAQKYVPDERDGKKHQTRKDKPEIAAIKTMTRSLQELHGKLSADLPFAKREIAYGKLTPDDLEAISKMLRSILLPVLGLASIMDIFERSAEINHWDGQEDDHDEVAHQQTVKEWNEMFKFVHEPLSHMFQALDDGLTHVALKLQLAGPPKKKGKNQGDTEAKGDSIKPGDAGFVDHLQKQADEFYNQKTPTLRYWVQTKGIKLRDSYFSDPSAIDDETLQLIPSLTTRKRDQRQLFLMLHIMFLMNATSRSIVEFVRFADKNDQAAKKNKFIWPGARRFKKWAKSVFQNQDANSDDETTAAGLERGNTTVYMGQAFKEKKDPEHLPPTNAWERFGNSIRGIASFLRSPESSFGFRVACATMSIAIVAFLHRTQTFFVEQRLVWALIMVTISMTPTAGQAIFQFILRIAGTAIAMIIAWLMWYIPGQKTPGIIVFLWFFIAIAFYIPLKRMDLVLVGIISVVTSTMIVGYELQVRKIGKQAAVAATGQPAYAIYILGPYRLATVIGGLAVAFFWTMFPYPITEHSALRQKLGGALYLSANFYSIMHEQVMGRIRGELAGDEECDKNSPGYQLVKARNKVFSKHMLTLQGLQIHASFVKWEFPLGGKFPREEYERIIGYIENIVNYTTLLGYTSAAFTNPSLQQQSDDPSSPSASTDQDMSAKAHWFNDFRRVITSAKVTSHETTSLLAMLSSSITNAQPLPPYLRAPPAAELPRKLEQIDPEILSLRHIAEPGYAAFAVMSVSTRCINMELEKLLKAVKTLVGELDFSFHVVSTKEAEDSGISNETLVSRSTTKRD